MPLSRPLPPLFLLPAWSYRQLHSGSTWVHIFAPKPGASETQSASSKAENVQKSSRTPRLRIKKHSARERVRPVGAYQDNALRWLPTSGPASRGLDAKPGTPYPDTIEKSSGASHLQGDNITIDSGRSTVAPGRTPRVHTEQTSRLHREETRNGSSGLGSKQVQFKSTLRTSENGNGTIKQGIRRVATSDEKGVKHLKLSGKNLAIPGVRDDPIPTNPTKDDGGSETTKLQLGSHEIIGQSISPSGYVKAVATNDPAESAKLIISRPWPAVQLKDSLQQQTTSSGLSKLSQRSAGGHIPIAAESTANGLTVRSKARSGSRELLSQPPSNSNDAATNKTAKKPFPQSRSTLPIAKGSKSSKSRAVSLTRDRYPPENQNPKPPPDTPPISLLEELFPEEAERHKRPTQKVEREIPRLILSADMSDLDNPRAALKRVSRDQAAHKNEIRMRRQQYMQDFRRQELSVMVLYNASKSLIEEDFRRISPKGRHVEGWNAEGDILKVIPCRHPTTLEPLGEYLLLFATPASAYAYYHHVRQLHNLSRSHTSSPQSITLPLPPGYTIDGQDIYAVLQDYALKPPSLDLHLKRLVSPLTPPIRDLVNQGGYPQLIAYEARSEFPVLFSVDGTQPSVYMIQEAINRDGRDRGLLWALSSSRKAISRLKEPISVQSTDYGNGADLPQAEVGEEGKARDGPTRWLISFQSEAEAQRFVRAWHRREFPVEDSTDSYGEPPPIVNAEALW